MQIINLKNKTASGKELQALFAPERGMNMISYKLGDIEVIDQSTREMFEKKFAGLGPLIGPHFHRRPLHLIPKIDENLFPHAQCFKGDALPDPFSHGVGRYAPWKVQFTETAFQARLSGKDIWNDIPLVQLEGQNFEMSFAGELRETGLHLELSVVSDADSLVGIHYYYHLADGEGTIFSDIQNMYIGADRKKQPVPEEWFSNNNNKNLAYPLDRETDFTFFPYPNPLEGKVILKTKTHQLTTTYQSPSEENSWQLWHPQGASFVCIEPISSLDPRHPNLTVSSLKIHIKIDYP